VAAQKIFQRRHKMGKKWPKSPKLELNRETQLSQNSNEGEKKLGEAGLMLESGKKTRQTKLDLVKFQEYLEENPTKFNREIGEVFGIKKSAAHKWKKRLGMTRKNAKTSYKEADLALKKVPRKAGNFDEKLELRTFITKMKAVLMSILAGNLAIL